MNKLLSRKFWMAIAGVATGIAMILGVDATEISSIAGGVVSLISVVSYIYTEGRIDSDRIKNSVDTITEAYKRLTD